MHPDTEAVWSVINATLEWTITELRRRRLRGLECRPQNVGPFGIFVCVHSVDGYDWSTVSVQHRTTRCMQGASFADAPTVAQVDEALHAVSAPPPVLEVAANAEVPA